MIYDGPSVERPKLKWSVSGANFPATEVEVARTVARLTTDESFACLAGKAYSLCRAWRSSTIPRQETVELFHRLHAGYQSIKDIFKSSHCSSCFYDE